MTILSNLADDTKIFLALILTVLFLGLAGIGAATQKTSTRTFVVPAGATVTVTATGNPTVTICTSDGCHKVSP